MVSVQGSSFGRNEQEFLPLKVYRGPQHEQFPRCNVSLLLLVLAGEFSQVKMEFVMG